MTGKLRVLLVDDHALFRSGVKALLGRQPDIEVVGEAADGLDGVQQARRLRPDMVLLDLHMPGASGRDALKALAEDLPGTRVLMLTVSEDADDLIETLQAGAAGYLLKNIDTDYFVDAIRRAAAGDSVISPQMTGKLVAGLKRGPVTAPDKELLSGREREVLAALARGASNKDLARQLDVSESTVKIHVQSILRKLGLNSRVQAAVYAVRHGIVDDPGKAP